MAGTIEGGKKTAAAILAKNPNHYKEAGAKGGRGSTGYAFGHGKVDPVEAGRKGGMVRGDKYKRAKKTDVFQIPKTNSKKMFGLWNR